MSGKLKAALVGCGRMGARTTEKTRQSVPQGWLPLSHAEAVASLDEYDLTALCDGDREALTRTGEMYGVDRRFTDYREMIETVRPDVLAVATRTPGRCEIIEFAAEHGVRGIHTEKPFSRNMAEARRAMAAVERHRVKLTYGALRRYMAAYRRAKDLLDRGEIGDLVEITVQHGSTMLMWNHPHSTDLLLYYAGALETDFVQGFCRIEEGLYQDGVLDADPVVDFAYIKFRNGVNGLISSAGGLNLQLSGTEGVITVGGDGSSLTLSKRRRPGTPYFLDHQAVGFDTELSGTQRAFRELAEAVKTDGQTSIQPAEILASQSILFRIALSSILQGQRTQESDLSDAFTVTGKFGLYYA